MNIQIFGRSKCFDTKKAERWFKERRIKFQSVDLLRFGLSGGEFDSVLRAVGGVDALIDWDAKSPEIDLMRYMDDKRAKEDMTKELETPTLEEYGIDKETFFGVIEKMAHDAMDSGSPQNTKRDITQSDVEKMYKELW